MDGLFPVRGQGPVHGVVVHHVGVAGIIGGHPEIADVGVFSLHRHAHLRQGQGAHVPGDAAADGLVHVVGPQLLAQQGDHKSRVLLDIDGIAAGEAENQVLGQGIIESHGFLRPLCLTQLSVSPEGSPDGVHRVGYHAVDGSQVAPEADAPVPAGPAVDHGGGAEIGAEPAVVPECLGDADGGAEHKACHLHPGQQPPGESHRGVPDAPPFPAGVNVRALYVALADIVAGLISPKKMAQRTVLLLKAYFSFPHILFPLSSRFGSALFQGIPQKPGTGF